LNPEDENFIDINEAREALVKVNEINWFDKYMQGGNIQHPKMALRLMRTFCKLDKTNLWNKLDGRVLEILIYKCLICMSPLYERLGIAQVLRCIFEFISSGAFYPNGASLKDSCRNPEVNLLSNFDVEFIKNLTSSAQDIVRLLVFDENGWDKLFPNLPPPPENFVIPERDVEDESTVEEEIKEEEEVVGNL